MRERETHTITNRAGTGRGGERVRCKMSGRNFWREGERTGEREGESEREGKVNEKNNPFEW